MWQYIILDFATGETVFTMDVSNKYGYNNMAIGMYAGNSGNAAYLPVLREWAQSPFEAVSTHARWAIEQIKLAGDGA